ncbi:MAG: 50S ribosomal protein L10 [Candidatus Eisenbacteria bacterium]
MKQSTEHKGSQKIRPEKVQQIARIQEILGGAKSVYLADFQGMTVEVISELRKRCRDANVQFEVVKNTMLRRAAAEAGREITLPELHGPTAIATSTVDEIAPARVLTEFLKQFKTPRLKGAVVDGRAYSEGEVTELANLPSREVLLGNLLRAMQGTLTGFASVLVAPVRDLACVLEQVAKGKGKAA